MQRRVKVPWLFVPVLIFLSVSALLVLRKDESSYGYDVTTPRASVMSFSLAPLGHVTKSLAELGPMDELGAHILFFNRVPKSGSEMLLLLIQWLQGWNNFRHVRLKDDNKRKLSRLEQEELVYAVYDRIKTDAIPLTFDRPVHFVNFSSFDRQSPTFINLIRDPVDNFVSRYQFVSTTESPQDLYSNKVIENKIPIETCIALKNPECTLLEDHLYDLTIPYFCGQDSRCMMHNNNWALQHAKMNVDRYYAVVGVLEEVNATLEALEQKLPYFFKGVQRIYYRDLMEPFHNRKNNKLNVSKSARKHLRKHLIKEYEFYEWIKSRLFRQLQVNTHGEHDH